MLHLLILLITFINYSHQRFEKFTRFILKQLRALGKGQLRPQARAKNLSHGRLSKGLGLFLY